MNEAMFSGSVPLEEAMEEKPAWVERLKAQGELKKSAAAPPVTWYRIIYYVFGYAVLICGVYLLINAIIYSRQIALH
jgi:hypothetical protein